MDRLLRSLARSTRGATMVEYIVAVGCVALLALVGVQAFGTSLYSKSRTYGDNVRDLTPTKGGSDYCFVAGTLVATPDGPKPIEMLGRGDAILSREDGGGDVLTSHVTETFVTPNAALVEVTFREAEALRVTPGHPFFTRDRHWIEAQALAEDEEVSMADGVVHVARVARLTERATVFNVEVEGTHTYFVGSKRAWVHNPNDCNGNPIVDPPATPPGTECTSGNCSGGSTCFVAGTPVATLDGPKPIESIRAGDWVLSKNYESGEIVIEPVTASFATKDQEVVAVRIHGRETPVIATPGHLFFTREHGWVKAAVLARGEQLVDPVGTTLEVDSVTAQSAHATVYNFEVSTTHTYFAGEWLAWVHNPDPDVTQTTTSLQNAPGLSGPGQEYINQDGLQYGRVGGKNGQWVYLNKPYGQGDGEYWYRAMSRAEYERLKANGGKIPPNPDPNAYGGIAPSHGYVTNPNKPYFNNSSGDVVVEFNAPGAGQAFDDAGMNGKAEDGVISYGLGNQGSKPPPPKKKPKKGKKNDSTPPPPTALDIFNDHLQSWQVVDAKIPAPPGWSPTASCTN